jgi:hypothetical protein
MFAIYLHRPAGRARPELRTGVAAGAGAAAAAAGAAMDCP